MSDGAQRVDLPCPRETEDQHIYALFGELPLSDIIELLSELNRKPIVLVGIPGLARRQLGATSESDLMIRLCRRLSGTAPAPTAGCAERTGDRLW